MTPWYAWIFFFQKMYNFFLFVANVQNLGWLDGSAEILTLFNFLKWYKILHFGHSLFLQTTHLAHAVLRGTGLHAVILASLV